MNAEDELSARQVFEGSETTPTIHIYTESAQADPLYVWCTGDGHAYMLGNSEHDIAWGMNVDIPRAVKAAIAYGLDGSPLQIADSIRAAARRGAIRGAQQVDGRWSLPRYTFRGWLVRTSEERRGRPRKP